MVVDISCLGLIQEENRLEAHEFWFVVILK